VEEGGLVMDDLLDLWVVEAACGNHAAKADGLPSVPSVILVRGCVVSNVAVE